MNADVEFHIRNNYLWSKLPTNVRQSLGNLQKEYEKAVFNFSVKNQLRYKGNLVRHVKKDEKRYYEDLLQYSRQHLMLYPYHLSDVIVRGLRTTPFAYYINIMVDIMTAEKSYDALPNFTAADCLRLLGIGRNQYIELMNQRRSLKKFLRKKPVRDLLPVQPVKTALVEPWWTVYHGYITEDDIGLCNDAEKRSIDEVIDQGSAMAGIIEYKVLHGLYCKGLIYVDVAISDDDCIIVPPLEGFVMNRVLGDYFETLLYKIFVSIDEHTTVAELASVLEIDRQLVKNAVSLYVRLGFAKKKGEEVSNDSLHPSWQNIDTTIHRKIAPPDHLLIDWTVPADASPLTDASTSPDSASLDAATMATDSTSVLNVNGGHSKRIAFLFDATLTAFLMMGNLSPGLKNHAVTMFEVGKLSDESLDSFLAELEKVDPVAEGEAQRYFDHAITLRSTIHFLRHSRHLLAPVAMSTTPDEVNGHGLDLLRCESLLSLDPATCARVLKKNYSLLVSMAPLSNEIRPISSCVPQHIGPTIPEVNSVWFKLYLYQQTAIGPPSLLLIKGMCLRRLPQIFQDYDRLLVTTWGHDSSVIPTSNILITLNDVLSHSPVLIQGHSKDQNDARTCFVPFPFKKSKDADDESTAKPIEEHESVSKVASVLDLRHTCGYITLLSRPPADGSWLPLAVNDVTNRSRSVSPRNGITDAESAAVLESELDSLDPATGHHGLSLDIARTQPDTVVDDWTLLDCCFGIPLFNADVNRTVCERIASEGICHENSLQELLHSSRELALSLLKFIADNQEQPVLTDTTSSPHGGSTPTQQSVPLPTHNIVFSDGVLKAWSDP